MKIRILALAVLLLTGCGEMRLSDFTGSTPEFRPESWFLGRLKAWGYFEDRFGRIRREFTVEIEGTLDGEVLVLDERFVYADGERQTRVWRVSKLADGSYEGRADDVVGIATGRVAGRAMNWQYDFDLAVGGSTWRVRFDDWMLLQDEDVMLNRTTVSKWGVEFGTVVIFFRRLPAEATGSAVERDPATYHLQYAAE
jgi:hypothetical protein